MGGLWAARNPRRYLGAVWLIVWLELLHGVVDDIYLIANGFSAGGYIPFIAIHLAIIITGVLFARQAAREVAWAIDSPIKSRLRGEALQ